jgi:hypothetical protein
MEEIGSGRVGNGDTQMSLCLTRSELAELTRCKLKAGQLAFPRKNGIRHYVDAHGWLVVARAADGIGIESKEKPVIKP